MIRFGGSYQEQLGAQRCSEQFQRSYKSEGIHANQSNVVKDVMTTFVKVVGE